MFSALPGLFFLILLTLSWKIPPDAAIERLAHLKIKKSL
jgi:hypothetical protein